jgi:hypothetical protein
MDEMLMLAAAQAMPHPPLKLEQLVVCISPTRGAQLARVQINPFTGMMAFRRVGGPAQLHEEIPDFLIDAWPFLVVDSVHDAMRKLRRLEEPGQPPDLLTACKEQHKAIDQLFALLVERTKHDKVMFYPSKSGQPWEAAKLGVAAIAAAERP